MHEWLKVYLPTGGGAFDKADLTKDRSADLQAVEKQPGRSNTPETGKGK